FALQSRETSWDCRARRRRQEANDKRNMQEVLFDANEEERLVTPERAANRSAELVLLIVQFVAERVRRSQRPITIEVKALAVNIICSRFGDGVDETSVGATDFRSSTGSHYLKFANRRLRKEEHCFIAASLISLETVIEV